MALIRFIAVFFVKPASHIAPSNDDIFAIKNDIIFHYLLVYWLDIKISK